MESIFEVDVASRCHCGIRCVLKTSWTNENLGRRFLGCYNYRVAGGCNYFKWVDHPVPPRENELITTLLRRCEESERKRHMAENKLQTFDEDMKKLHNEMVGREEKLSDIMYVAGVMNYEEMNELLLDILHHNDAFSDE
ncbi:uncharacterized protein Fot_36398 [Forsythia ovata]|uniref:GRF-type domain-containing protein n=1 Tax=Forsythia ovata TaxID=205694 RepID=A0ABD1SPB9_9LAMI